MTKKKKIIEPEYHEKERSKRKIRLVYYRKVAMVNQKTCSKKFSALLLLLVNERLAAERNFKIKLHFIWCGSASKATLNTFIHSLRVHTNTCACGQTAMISFLRVWDNIRDYDVMIVLHRVKQQSNHTYTDKQLHRPQCKKPVMHIDSSKNIPSIRESSHMQLYVFNVDCGRAYYQYEWISF